MGTMMFYDLVKKPEHQPLENKLSIIWHIFRIQDDLGFDIPLKYLISEVFQDNGRVRVFIATKPDSLYSMPDGLETSQPPRRNHKCAECPEKEYTRFDALVVNPIRMWLSG
jgi:Cdc14 phosphatase binding protein N-terminus